MIKWRKKLFERQIPSLHIIPEIKPSPPLPSFPCSLYLLFSFRSQCQLTSLLWTSNHLHRLHQQYLKAIKQYTDHDLHCCDNEYFVCGQFVHSILASPATFALSTMSTAPSQNASHHHLQPKLHRMPFIEHHWRYIRQHSCSSMYISRLSPSNLRKYSH